jgi:hypothetical protein
MLIAELFDSIYALIEGALNIAFYHVGAFLLGLLDTVRF